MGKIAHTAGAEGCARTIRCARRRAQPLDPDKRQGTVNNLLALSLAAAGYSNLFPR